MVHEQIHDSIRESQRFIGRALAAAALVVVMFGVLLARQAQLQVVMHEHYQTESRENRVKLVPLPPTRGLIYDRNGILLADNFPAYSLEITPEQVEDIDQTLDELAELVRIDETDRARFQRLLKQKRRFESIPVRSNLNEAELARFSVHRHRFPGVDVAGRLLRYYPRADKTAHVLGYVGRISERDLQTIDTSEYAGTTHIGKIGVEKTYEDTLHGSVGLQQVEVNAAGRVVSVLESQAPRPGHNLRLHLDSRLQAVAMAAFGDYNGAAVAMDPNTGGVLALASHPGYDPNPFVEGISSKAYQALRKSDAKPLYNRAIRGQYPPGSTVKPFVGLAGLETGAVRWDEEVFCPGFFQLPGKSHKYRDWKRWGHGKVDLDTAITQSCDVYFYKLANDMGVDALHDYLQHFGFGSRSGIDLTGELSGLLPSRAWKRRARRQVWFPGETLIMGIGQGYYLATPLQLAAATAAFANGGVYVTPRIVAEERDLNDVLVREIEAQRKPIPIKHPDNWQDVRQAMTHVVEGARGTARRLRNPHYRIAGKTGTAQVFTVKQDEEYDEDKVAKKMRDHALFVAFAPIEEPKIAVAVIVENGGHGGSVAGPIAKQIMDAWLLEESP